MFFLLPPSLTTREGRYPLSVLFCNDQLGAVLIEPVRMNLVIFVVFRDDLLIRVRVIWLLKVCEFMHDYVVHNLH